MARSRDAYIISDSVNGPLSTFKGKLAAIIHRRDDVEDKFVITSQDETLTKEDIQQRIFGAIFRFMD